MIRVKRLEFFIDYYLKNGEISFLYFIYRGSNSIAYKVLLKLLNKLRKRYKCKALPNILLFFAILFNKFNNMGAQMLDCIAAYAKPTILC